MSKNAYYPPVLSLLGVVPLLVASTPTQAQQTTPVTQKQEIPPVQKPDFFDDLDNEVILPLTNDPTQLPALAPNTPQQNNSGSKSTGAGTLTVQKFTKLRWMPSQQRMQSQGQVQIVQEAPGDGRRTTLTASDIDFDSGAQEIDARGGVRIKRKDGLVTARSLKYNFETQSGTFEGAIAETDAFRMSGQTISVLEDGSYQVTNGVFTTCQNVRPDYRIRAGSLKVSPNRYVSAKRITLYLGSTKLITLPSFRRNLRTASQISTFTPGYNTNEGLFLRFRDTPIARSSETFDYDIRLNARRAPTGFLVYQRDLRPTSENALPPRGLLNILEYPQPGFLESLAPPTFRDQSDNRSEDSYRPRQLVFGSLVSNQFVVNRLRNDLLVSRFPEFGVRFTNVLGNRNTPNLTMPESTTPFRPGDPASVAQRFPNAPFLLDLTAGLGAFHELPTRATAGRVSLRANLATQPVFLSKNLIFRAGGTNTLNLYTNGNIYNLFSPEVELNYLPTRSTLFGIGYRYSADGGKSPFFFDQVDVVHELRLRFQTGRVWAFGYTAHYDLSRKRAFDGEIALIRNFDCLQVGFGYRVRTQSFNLLFNLLPPQGNREENRMSPIGSLSPNAATVTAQE